MYKGFFMFCKNIGRMMCKINLSIVAFFLNSELKNYSV